MVRLVPREERIKQASSGCGFYDHIKDDADVFQVVVTSNRSSEKRVRFGSMPTRENGRIYGHIALYPAHGSCLVMPTDESKRQIVWL